MRSKEAKIKTGQRSNPPLPPFAKGGMGGFLSLLLLCLFASSSLAAAPGKMGGDGHILIYNYQTGEFGEETYRTSRGYDKDALEKIYSLLKSPDGQVIKIPTALIELLNDIQEHFGAETVEIISGYRSPSYNKTLRSNGRNVASESWHTKGMAADIHLDEISEESVRDYVMSLKRGGVGFYPALNFVHADLGPVRTWQEADSKERVLVGVQANPNESWRVITDKNKYHQGDVIKATVTNAGYEKMVLTTNVWYERFRKGDWTEHMLLNKQKKKYKVKPQESVDFEFKANELPFGKYRLVIFTSKDFSIPPAYSNEFYIKKE
jgi:uncharacterized protein YcbK (DUF882 family)